MWQRRTNTANAIGIFTFDKKNLARILRICTSQNESKTKTRFNDRRIRWQIWQICLWIIVSLTSDHHSATHAYIIISSLQNKIKSVFSFAFVDSFKKIFFNVLNLLKIIGQMFLSVCEISIYVGWSQYNGKHFVHLVKCAHLHKCKSNRNSIQVEFAHLDWMLL